MPATPPTLEEIPGTTHRPVTREMIPLDRIKTHLANPRLQSKLDVAKIQELVQTMKGGGLLQAIRVFAYSDGSYRIVYGHRRVEAARKLGWETIPADVMPAVPSDVEVTEMRAVENLGRKDLNAAEKALAVHQLVEAATPLIGREAAIKRAVGAVGCLKDEDEVKDCLYVVDRLTDKSRDLLAGGWMNFAQARELAKVGDKQIQEKYAGWIEKQAPDGASDGGKIVSITELRGWIANEKHSLRVVGWKLDVPFNGKPACVGCPHNSATDPVLFNDEQDPDNAAGTCLNHGCFEFKASKVVAANTATVKKISEQVKQKKIEKDDAGSAAIIRDAAPDFVKEATVQRFVKKELGVKEKKGDKAGGGAAAAKKGESEKQRRQKALWKWGAKYREWAEARHAAIDKEVKGDGLASAAFILLQLSQSLMKHSEYEYPSHEYGFHGATANMVEPPEEVAMKPGVARIIEAAAKQDFKTLGNDADLAEYGRSDFSSGGPELIHKICKAFGVTEVDPPSFEDFLPADLRTQKKAGTKAPDTVEIIETDYYALSVTLQKIGDEFHAGIRMRFVPGEEKHGPAPVNSNAGYETRELAIKAAAGVGEAWFNNLLTKSKSLTHKTILTKARDEIRAYVKKLKIAEAQ